MSNPVIQRFRELDPVGTKNYADDDLTLYVWDNTRDNPAFDEDPEFRSQALKLVKDRNMVTAPSLPQEFGRGFAAAGYGLLGTGAGALAALSHGVGAQGATEYWLDKARQAEAAAGETPPTIPGWEQAETLGEKARYLINAAGQAAPSVLESVGTGLVGAAAGSAAGPGGTVGGAIGGFVEKQAVKTLIKKYAEKQLKGMAEDAAETWVKQNAKDELKQLASQKLKQYAADIAIAANSYGLSTGELYNDLRRNPNISPDDAFDVAVAGGVVAAIPDTFLPHYIVGKFFKGTPSKASHGYMIRFLGELGTTLPMEGGTEAFQEYVNYAAQRYADPTMRDKPLTPAEKSGILNAGIIGAIGGGMVAPFTAWPGGTPPNQQPPKPGQPSQTSTGGMNLTEPMTGGWSDLSGTDKDQIIELFKAYRAGTPLTSTQENLAGHILRETDHKDQQRRTYAQAIWGQNQQWFPDTESVNDLLQPTVAQPPTVPVAAPPTGAANTVPGAPLTTGGINAVTTGQEQASVPSERGGTDVNLAGQAPPGSVQAIVEGQSTQSFPGNSVPNATGVVTPTTTLPQADTPTTPTAAVPSPAVAVAPASSPLVPTPEPAPVANPATTEPVIPESRTTETPVPTPEPTIAPAPSPPITPPAPPLLSSLTQINADTGLGMVDWNKTKPNKGEGKTGKGRKVAGVFVTTPTGKKPNWPDEIFADTGHEQDEKTKDHLSNKLVVFAKDDGSHVVLANAVKYNDKKVISFPDATGRVVETPLPDILRQGYSVVATIRSMHKVTAYAVTMPKAQWDAMRAIAEHRNDSRMQGIEVASKEQEADLAIQPSITISKTTKQPRKLAKVKVLSNIEKANVITDYLDSKQPIDLANDDDVMEIIGQAMAQVFNYEQLLKQYGDNAGALISQLGTHIHESLENIATKLKSGKLKPEQAREALVTAISEHKGVLEEAGSPAEVIADNQDDQPEDDLASTPPEHAYSGGAGIYPNTTEVREQFERLTDNVMLAGAVVKTAQALTDSGQYSHGTITLGIVNSNHPTVENFGLLLHEAFHFLFEQLPLEIRTASLTAINGMTNEMLGIAQSTDPRVLQNDIARIELEFIQAGMSPEQARVEAPVQMVKERFAEHLRMQGLQSPMANDIASKIIRFIKDLFYQIALGVQQAFGRAMSPDLALGYVRNRFESMISGQPMRMNLFQYLVPPPTIAQQVQMHAPMDQSGWLPVRVVNGRWTYGETVDMPTEMAYDVQHAYSEPPLSTTPTLKKVDALTQTVTVLNEGMAINGQVLAEIQAMPMVQKAQGRGSLANWVKGALGLPDFEAVKAKELDNAKDPMTKAPVQVDDQAFIRTDRFSLEYQKRMATNLYERLTKGRIKISHKVTELKAKIKSIATQAETAAKELAESTRNWDITENLVIEVRQGIRQMLNDFAKVNGALWAKAPNEIISALRELNQGRFTPEAYQQAVKDYLGRANIENELFELVSEMANNTAINFNGSVTDLQTTLRTINLPQYYSLTGQDTATFAKLASVYAYAQSHAWMLVRMELRKSTDHELRISITDKLLTMFQGPRGVTTPIGAINALERAAKLIDRARQAYLEERRSVKDLEEQVIDGTATIEAGEAAMKIYEQAMNQWAGVAQIADKFVFGEGAKLMVPVKGTNGLWELKEKILHVDYHKNPTNIAEYEEWKANMAEFKAERETLWNNGNRNALDGQYHQIDQQLVEMGKVKFTPDVVETIHRQIGWSFKQLGEKFRSIGTAAGRLVTQMLKKRDANAFLFGRESVPYWRDVEQSLADVLGVMDPKWRSVDMFKELFFNPCAGFLSKAFELANANMPTAAKWDMAFRQWEQRMLNLSDHDPRKEMIKGKEHKFSLEIRKLMEANERFDKWVLSHTTVPVEYKDGKTRGRVTLGLAMTMRNASAEFAVMHTAMMNQGWVNLIRDEQSDPFKKHVFSDVYNKAAKIGDQEGPDAVRTFWLNYFNDPTVWDLFVRELAYNLDGSPFPAIEVISGMSDEGPQLSDLPVNPFNVQQAFNGVRQGDIVGLAEAIADREVAQYQLNLLADEKGKYVQKVLEHYAGIWKHMNNSYERANGIDSGTYNGISNMVPSVMLYGRQNESWPDRWFRYELFDRNAAARVVEKMAAQEAYGPNNERLATALVTAKQELTTEVNQYRLLLDKLKLKGGDNMKQRDRRRMLTEMIQHRDRSTPEQARKVLEKHEKDNAILSQLDDWQADLINNHRHAHSPMDARTAVTAIKFIARMMVNAPGSALTTLFDATSFVRELGLSGGTMRALYRTPFNASKEFINGLGQMVGITTLLQPSQDRAALNRYQFDERSVYQNWKQYIAQARIAPNETPGPISKTNRGIRIARRALEQGINPRGRQAKWTVIKPASPFDTMAMLFNVGVMENTLRMVREYVDQAITWQDQNNKPSEFGRGNYLEWAENCKIDEVFPKLIGRLSEDYGVDFTELVNEARQRIAEGQYHFSKNTTGMIAAMSQIDFSLDGGIANAIPGTRTSTFIGPFSVLLNWPIKQSLAVSRMGMDARGAGSRWFRIPQGKEDYAALTRMLAGLMVMTAGGLAVGMLVDWYNEELLGKRRNLRKMAFNQGVKENLYALSEQTARIGVLGILGDVINATVNVGTGEGDNRGFSLDQRVVVASTIQTVMRSFSSFFHQDYVADYANVIRPLLVSTVGNGALQYLDMVNNAFGFDNQESRVIARINAQNWLRATGRALEMEVRKSSAGGFNTPNPVTPWVTKMQLAALGNNPADFMAAFERAKAEAKEAEKENPEQYVKEAYSSRHPLRRIFNVTVTDSDYRRLLNAMPEGGRRDVEEAIRLFNHYGESIGVNPFTGKEEEMISPSREMAKYRRSLYGNMRPTSNRFSIASMY